MDETNKMDNQNYAGFQRARTADAVNTAPAAAQNARRMSGVTAIFLVLTALAIDGLQIFLNLIVVGVVLNWIVDIFAWLLFFVWLKSLGVSMADAKGRRILLFLCAALGFELLPLINTLPGWTAFAVLTIIYQ